MAQNADKAQLPRLKAIFEKRNLKHNVEIHKAQVKRLAAEEKPVSGVPLEKLVQS